MAEENVNKEPTGSIPRISDERIAHMHGVAEYMYRHASDDFYRLDKDQAYMVGLLHDIGYIEGKSHHESFGGILLMKMGFKDCQIIAEHGKQLDQDSINNKKLLLLVEADMHVSSASKKEITYEEKLKELAAEHGKDSKAYALCEKNIRFLQALGRN